MNITGPGFSNPTFPSSGTGTSIDVIPGSTTVKTTPGRNSWTFSGNDKNASIGSKVPSTSSSYQPNWLWYNFFGGSTSGVTNNTEAQALISSLTQLNLDTNKTMQWTTDDKNSNTSQYTYIAYPSSYGHLSTMTQNGAIDIKAAFIELGSYVYTNSQDVNVNMYIYKSTIPGAYVSGSIIRTT